MTTALYQDVATELRTIVSTKKPGELLPSEIELTKLRGRPSRQTVRRALETIASEGLITPYRRRGWAVRDQHRLVWVASDPETNTITAVTPADSWANSIRAQGREPEQKIDVETIAARGHIAELLRLGPGDYITVRRIRRWVDRQLMNIADTYYPEALVAGTPIARPDDVIPGTYKVMEDIGHGFRHHQDRLIFRPPTAEEKDLFNLAVGVAVLDHTRIRRDKDDRVVAVTNTVLPGDRNEIVYEGKDLP